MTNRRKLHVVLDSVIAVSAFLTEGLTADLVSQCHKNVNLYTTEEILQEIRQVLLEKPHIRNRYTYSSDTVEIFIEYLRNISTVVTQLPEIRVIERDPKDDMIISCAIAASANYIISRDRDLLDLGNYQQIQIVTPEEFIQILRAGE
ncbi:MAG: putative toxin-antitoxin system toxin component, PIN family [Candidatus Poribacteria bacterium]|nr:putative toxin-antitoxin system toxin component, PIN family [Candidatus Poribacteria bacterium]